MTVTLNRPFVPTVHAIRTQSHSKLGQSVLDLHHRHEVAMPAPECRHRTQRTVTICLRRWYELVLAAQDDIATIMTVESGKPLAESKAEFLGGCAILPDGFYLPSDPANV